ncbi:MAG: T9SS type A sorting domain-containing protein [Cryomorphaceae bacterium]
MKKALCLLLVNGLFMLGVHAQNEATITERKIEIEEGEYPTVTITTTENGKTTIQELEGQAAEDYLRAREESKSAKAHAKRSVIEIDINEDDIEAMKESMREVRLDIEEEMKRVSEELKDLNMDSIMESIGVEVDRSMDEVRYRFKADNDDKTSVMVIRSKENDDDAEVDVEVEVRSANDERSKDVRVTRTKMVVEDHAAVVDGKSDLKHVSIYPVPANGEINVAFENKGGGSVHLQVLNLQGEAMREMKVKGKGKKQIKMNLDDLPAGTYLIELSEGGTHITKRLIVE